MKRNICVATIGTVVCLCIPAARGDGDVQPKRMVCDETCKIEFTDSKAAPSSGSQARILKWVAISFSTDCV